MGMALAMAMANGVPGVSGGAPPSRQWMDDRLREQLQRDERVGIITDVHESPEVVAAARAEEAAATGRPAPQVRRPYVRDYRKVAYRAAVRAGIRRPKLFVRQIAAESAFQPCARSYAGALGIAQIMPATARSWKVDPHIPDQALAVAAKHMARYERQYGSYRLALAAYNAGPGAVKQYGGVPPYAETREYIRRITDTSYPLPRDSVFRINPGMDPDFERRLYALIRDVRRRGGGLHINDGWRSYQESLVIWRHAKRRYGGWQGAKQWAAPPGCSNHVRGYAADLRGSLRLAHRLAPRHGLVFPMSWEPWHVERRGISTQSG